MEPTRKDSFLGTSYSENQNDKDKCDAEDIQEQMKKVEVKTSSPTSLLAKNSLILPTGVIRPKQNEVKAKTEIMSSSGSATGKNFFIENEKDLNIELRVVFPFFRKPRERNMTVWPCNRITGG